MCVCVCVCVHASVCVCACEHACIPHSYERSASCFVVSAPKLSPVITPVMRWCGFLESLPRLTDAARKIVEMRSKEGKDFAVSYCFNSTYTCIVSPCYTC